MVQTRVCHLSFLNDLFAKVLSFFRQMNLFLIYCYFSNIPVHSYEIHKIFEIFNQTESVTKSVRNTQISRLSM